MCETFRDIAMTIAHLVTHSGGFHADELLSSVVLTGLFPHAELKRSRDPRWLAPEQIRAGDPEFPGDRFLCPAFHQVRPRGAQHQITFVRHQSLSSASLNEILSHQGQ